MHMHLYMYIYIYIFIYTCIYIHIYLFIFMYVLKKDCRNPKSSTAIATLRPARAFAGKGSRGGMQLDVHCTIRSRTDVYSVHEKDSFYSKVSSQMKPPQQKLV